jgi:hypothetical protein
LGVVAGGERSVRRAEAGQEGRTCRAQKAHVAPVKGKSADRAVRAKKAPKGHRKPGALPAQDAKKAKSGN